MIKVGALTKKWDSQTCTGGNWADMSENLELLHFSKLLSLAEVVSFSLFFFSFFFFFFFFGLFRAAPAAHDGGSQASGLIGATAASL